MRKLENSAQRLAPERSGTDQQPDFAPGVKVSTRALGGGLLHVAPGQDPGLPAPSHMRVPARGPTSANMAPCGSRQRCMPLTEQNEKGD